MCTQYGAPQVVSIATSGTVSSMGKLPDKFEGKKKLKYDNINAALSPSSFIWPSRTNRNSLSHHLFFNFREKGIR